MVVFCKLILCVQMKTPMTLGQKKTKAIDQLLEELGVGKPGAHEGCINDLCSVKIEGRF